MSPAEARTKRAASDSSEDFAALSSASVSSEDGDKGRSERRSPQKRSSKGKGKAANVKSAKPKTERTAKKARHTKNATPSWLDAVSAEVAHNAAVGALSPPCQPPDRIHVESYHRPRLLDSRADQHSLFAWFEAVQSDRQMPWRREWIDPATVEDPKALRDQLKLRAYHVFVSELMLQQTRVSTVIEYFTRWMTLFPSIEALAAAEPEAVMSAWKGLGYYSRATRTHAAAQKVVGCSTMAGLLPERPEDLQRDVPGVGPYTAGAISSIVFGHAVPLVDGNVIRVLSRQLGLYASKKAKTTTDLLWIVAERLVSSATRAKLGIVDGDKDLPRSSWPGKWNQALMELGSTVCTPKPSCGTCPISSTCMAYAEGEIQAVQAGLLFQHLSPLSHGPAPIVPDLEDLCTLCQPFEGSDEEIPATKGKGKIKGKAQTSQPKPLASSKSKQSTLAGFIMTRPRQGKDGHETSSVTSTVTTAPRGLATLSPAALELIDSHTSKFPPKDEVKKAREEDWVVCVLERQGQPASMDKKATASTFLVEQRPSSGLLASLWQLPSVVLDDGSAKYEVAASLAARLLADFPPHEAADKAMTLPEPASPSFVGIVPHQFSHISLKMHVYHSLVPTSPSPSPLQSSPLTSEEIANYNASMTRTWVERAELEKLSIGTGMLRAWEAVCTRKKRSLQP